MRYFFSYLRKVKTIQVTELEPLTFLTDFKLTQMYITSARGNTPWQFWKEVGDMQETRHPEIALTKIVAT